MPFPLPSLDNKADKLSSDKNAIKSQPALCAVPILLPISTALHFTHQSPVAIFIVSLVGIVPLAGGLGFAYVNLFLLSFATLFICTGGERLADKKWYRRTEEIAHRVGEAWGGLLNATFGLAQQH